MKSVSEGQLCVLLLLWISLCINAQLSQYAGGAGRALSFDGDDCLLLPRTLDIFSGFTMSVFLKPNQVSGQSVFLALGNQCSTGTVNDPVAQELGLVVFLDDQMKLEIMLPGSEGGCLKAKFDTSLSPQNYHHIMIGLHMNSTSASYTILLNGTSTTSDFIGRTSPLEVPFFGNASLPRIGCSINNQTQYTGILDELSLWRQNILTDASDGLDYIFNVANTSSDNLIAYYKFNEENTTTTFADTRDSYTINSAMDISLNSVSLSQRPVSIDSEAPVNSIRFVENQNTTVFLTAPYFVNSSTEVTSFTITKLPERGYLINETSGVPFDKAPLVLNVTGGTGNITLRYTPTPHLSGFAVASIVFYANASQSKSSAAVIYIHSKNVNDPPFAGASGYALMFDGIDDWGGLRDFGVGDRWTVEMWMLAGKLGDDRYVYKDYATLSKHYPNGSNIIVFGSYPTFGSKAAIIPHVRVRSQSRQCCASNSSYPWHWAVTFKPLGTTKTEIEMFINGTSISVQQLDDIVGNVVTGLPWSIGQEFDGPTVATPSDFYPGMMDELKIYNSVRTQEQILEDMNLAISPSSPKLNDSSLIGYWSFDESPNYGVIVDQGSNRYHGLLGGNSSLAKQYSPYRIYSSIPLQQKYEVSLIEDITVFLRGVDLDDDVLTAYIQEPFPSNVIIYQCAPDVDNNCYPGAVINSTNQPITDNALRVIVSFKTIRNNIINNVDVPVQLLYVLHDGKAYSNEATVSILGKKLPQLICPAGTQKYRKPETAIEICVPCSKDYFNLLPNSDCKPCPTGGECDGGSSVKVKQNYWYDEASGLLEPEFHMCYNRKCCDKLDGCPLNQTCRGLYTGVLCSECPYGYYDSGLSCIELKPEFDLSAAYIAVLVIVSIIFVTVIFMLPRQADLAFTDSLFFLQVSTLLVNYLGSHKNFLALFSFKLDVLNIFFGANSKYYMIPASPITKLYFDILLPLMLLALCVLCLGVTVLWKKIDRMQNDKLDSFRKFVNEKLIPSETKKKPLRQVFMDGFMNIIVIISFAITHSSIMAFACRRVGPRLVLSSHPSIECFRGSHVGIIITAIPILFVFLLLIPYMIYRTLKKLKNKNKIDYNNPHAPFGNLYKPYDPEHYTYLTVDFAMKAVIIFTSVIFSYADIPYTLAMAFVIAFIILHQSVFPYVRADFDRKFRVVLFTGLFMLCLLRALRIAVSTTGSIYREYEGTVDVLEWLVILVPFYFVPANLIFTRYKAKRGGNKNGTGDSKSLATNRTSVIVVNGQHIEVRDAREIGKLGEGGLKGKEVKATAELRKS